MTPEPTPSYQRELDTLLASGYAEIDQGSTYHWTRAGRLACYTHHYTTPVAYAEAMRRGEIRHCIHCGRTTVGIKVGARFERGGKAQKNRTVCVACARAGKGLEGV